MPSILKGKTMWKYLSGMLVAVFIVIVINIVVNGIQRWEISRQDEMSWFEKHLDQHQAISHKLSNLIPKMNSPRAQIVLAENLLAEGEIDKAASLFADAVWKDPSLSLAAGKISLEYAKNGDDLNIAARYFKRATMQGNQAESYRLLGYLSLKGNHQISCSSWRRALNLFQQAAKRGDGISQIITGLSYSIGLGSQKNDRKLLGYLLMGEDSDDQPVSTLAKEILDTFAVFFLPTEAFPDDFGLSPYPSEMESRNWLVKALELGLPDDEAFQSDNPQALPEFCYAEK